jgi:hypothetical protein
MGNVFSGRPGPRGGKTAVEALPKVSFKARAAPSTNTAPRVALDGPDLAHITYGPLEWFVHLATTTPHFGGTRRWLVCPRCSSRRGALYVAGAVLACRTCLDLRYASQHETERDRLFRRAHKLRDRLGWGGGLADTDGGRPRGVHETTYRRLRTNLASVAAQILAELRSWTAAAEAVLAHSDATHEKK